MRTANQRQPALLAINEINAGTSHKFAPFHDSSGAQIGVAHPTLSFTVHDEPSPIIIGILCVFWIAVWLAGVKRVVSRG